MAFIVPFIPLIAAGIGAAATGIAIAEEPSAPAAPTVSQNASTEAQAQADAAQAQASALTRRRGMAATTLQNPLTSTGTAATQKSTLGA